MARIAISYRRSDTQAMTGRIFDRLVDRYGDDSVFMDIDKIPFGFDFREQIREVLEQSDIILIVVGPDWVSRKDDGSNRLADEADPVRFEMEMALHLKKPLIPVLVNDASMPRASELPESIRQLVYFNAAEIDAGRDFRVHMDRLMKAMDQILARRAAPAKEVPDPPQAPAAREPDPLPAPVATPVSAAPPPAPAPAAAPIRKPDPPAPAAPAPEPAPATAAATTPGPAATPPVRPAAAAHPPPVSVPARPAIEPSLPIPEFAAPIDWRGTAALLLHSLAAAGVTLIIYYGFDIKSRPSDGTILLVGSVLTFLAAGAVLYWRRRYLGGRAFAMGAIGTIVVFVFIYPGADPSTVRAFQYFGPIAMIGALTKFQLVVIIGMLAALAAIGNVAAQFLARFRTGRGATLGFFTGLVTRAPRKPLLTPLAPATGRRRLAVIACLFVLPTLLLTSAYLTQFLSENEEAPLFFVVVSAALALVTGFLACRLAGLLGIGSIAIGSAIALVTILLARIVQQALQTQTDVSVYWSSPFLPDRTAAVIERTLYYGAALALAALAGNLLAQAAGRLLRADGGLKRGFLASLSRNEVPVLLAGFLLAAAGSYIAFRFALYPYCVAHTPFTLTGLCSST